MWGTHRLQPDARVCRMYSLVIDGRIADRPLVPDTNKPGPDGIQKQRARHADVRLQAAQDVPRAIWRFTAAAQCESEAAFRVHGRPANTHPIVEMHCSMAAYSTSEGVKPASRMSASTAMAWQRRVLSG